MTDKEKQIEEMAKDMGIAFQLAGTTRFGAVAEKLISMHWVKLPTDSVVLSKEEREQLKAFIKGEWVDTEIIEKALNIDFSTGLKLFEFSRTAEWNKPPLNGQNITTKFKLKDKSKETAEKIYKLVDNNLDLYRNGVIGGTLYDSGYQTAISNIKRKIKDIFCVEIKE